MKKWIFGMVAVLSVSAFAQEAFLGAGYDFYRHGANKNFGSKKFQGNATIRGEWFPMEGTNFKAGMGIAQTFNFRMKTSGGHETLGSGTPFYAVFKPEWQINDNTKFYNKYRLGWSFNANKHNKKSGTYALDSKFKSGPYAGAEVGFEFGKVAVGLVYDVNYIPSRDKAAKQNKGTPIHQLGLQVGYVFGGEGKVKTQPVVIKPAPVPVVEEVPKEEPVPVVQKVYQDGKSTVLFQFDHPAVDLPEEQKVLDYTKNELNKYEYVDVDVVGHTDNKGSDAYNEKLGKKRAENVANEIRNSTDPAKVKVNSVRSAGEKEPAFPNDTAEGRRKNRRVEINFKGWFDQQEDIH